VGLVDTLFGRFRRKSDDEYAVRDADWVSPVQALDSEALHKRGGLAFPRFREPALGRGTGRSEESGEVASARIALRNAFTPAQPVTDRRMFAGRLRVLSRLIEVIEDRLSHVVVFGERGIGKTSLLHILADLAQESRYLVLRGTCGAGSRFDEMFRNLLQDVPVLYLRNMSPTDHAVEEGATLASRLPAGDFDARELSDLLGQITGTRILILLDEYDRLENEQFRQYTAELIKNLSDRAAPVQLIIAGVSSNLHELIGYIPSIRRNVIGLPMPRLSAEEVQSIVSIGEANAGMLFEPMVSDLIYALSNGSPYMTRLICHHASGIALDEGRKNVTRSDIEASLDRMVEEAEGRLSFATAQRVRRLEIGDRASLLGLVARVASTPDGWFSRNDMVNGIPEAAQAEAAMNLVQSALVPSRLVDEDNSDSEARYRFVDEGLPNYLWMMVARNQFHGVADEAAKAAA
jgi:Cdc6-like AAA superfamily ATPase